MIVAYGAAKHAPPGFYPYAIVAGLPFLVIPASLGAILTMLVSAYLPARKARVYSIGLLLGALGVSAVIVKLMGLRSMLLTAGQQDFAQIGQGFSLL